MGTGNSSVIRNNENLSIEPNISSRPILDDEQINFIKSKLNNVEVKLNLLNNLEENIKNIFNCTEKNLIYNNNNLLDKISNIQNQLIL